MRDPKHETALATIAAQLELARADRVLKQCAGHVSPPTVARVLRRHDHRISTLIDIADALNCDVEIVIRKRIA